MTTNHNFNSFDVRMEDSTSIAGRIVLIIMLLVFLAASMITTFSFFYTYAPGLGRVIHPDYAGYVAGTMGVLLFDLAGLGWTVLRSRNSDTTHQFTIATLAAITTIVLSLITSGLYVALSSAFDIGLYTTGGSLSQFGQAMQIAGVAIMTLGFVLNFGAIAAYVNVSRETAQAVHQTQMRGYVAQGRFAADRTRAQLELERTLDTKRVVTGVWPCVGRICRSKVTTASPDLPATGDLVSRTDTTVTRCSSLAAMTVCMALSPANWLP